MTTTQHARTVDAASAERLAEQLADVFRTGTIGEVFTDDLFLDGHPPFWRFQVDGLEAFAEWLDGYPGTGHDIEVLRTVPTQTGFVTEQASVGHEDGQEVTARKVLLCTVRDGRISELVVYCSGDWDAELRERHAREAPIHRP